MKMIRWISALVIAAALGGVDVPPALAAIADEGWRVLEKARSGKMRYGSG